MEWEKGLFMNKLFPLLILAAIILGTFLTLAYFTSAYAQQHDSPASAQKLDANHPISLTLPAYATEYFYFSLPNVEDNIPTITLSDSSGIHIQLYDSREVSQKYSISSSHKITFCDSLSSGERYFLKLSNQSSQDIKIKVTLNYTAKSKESVNTQKVVKPQKSVKPKKTVKPKTSTRTRQTEKPKKSIKKKNSTKPKTTIKSKRQKNSGNAAKITNTTAIHTPKPQKKTSLKPTTSLALTPQKSADPITTNPNSKSNFLLSTHFLRIKAGTSLAIAEALNLSEKSSSLSYQCIFSNRLSIQNGILYAKSSGIAVIEITEDNFKSSCTICIQ